MPTLSIDPPVTAEGEPGKSTETPASRGDAAIATAEFLLRLRGKGVRDLAVLRALETVPRQVFVPHRYADLASRDVALPIGCGQTMPAPYSVARILEMARLRPQHRVLEIGTGSGYLTAVLARLVAEVVSIERFQTLATEARTRLAELEIGNAAVVWGDGLRIPSEAGRFDRIIVEALVADPAPAWLRVLTDDGVLVIGQDASSEADGVGRAGHRLLRLARQQAGEISEASIASARLQPLIAGLAQGL
jgi:protein-L-isoaspartate(D-aspartate) O-methyltransferase